MDSLNKQKNETSYIRLNDWLNKLLCLKWEPIQNHFDIQINDNLKEIVEEYQALITIAEPSPAEQIRIEEILELAVYDTVLSKLIDRVEQDIAKEIGLFDDNVSNSHNSTDKPITSEVENNNYLQNDDDKIIRFPLVPVSHPIQKKYVCRPQINIASAILGGAVVLGTCLLNPFNLFNESEGEKIDQASVHSQSIPRDLRMATAESYLNLGINYGIRNEGYILQNATTKNLQQVAEEKQICFESKQLEAEREQQFAEKRQSLNEAKKLKEEAQFYLDIARYFHKVANDSSLQAGLSSIAKTGCP
ncbi:MAG: hypothetical protein MET45_10790 [Nostoc sp. LLA-1]|nr:hypothetical protein [Cyanocohniella sp. LLY]